MKTSCIKYLLVAGVTTFATAAVTVFAQTNIDTDIFNAVQTIMRTVYTDNGSDSGDIIAEVNSLSGSSYFLQNVGVQTNNPNANLQVVGNVTFGDTKNRAGYPNDNQFNSVLGGIENHIETTRSSIAGGVNNNIVADAGHSFIGGGGYNTAHAWASTVGGGEYNTINNGYATAYATIAGGKNNTIMGEMSTIGGGGYNIISKSFSTIAGGFQNGADGNFSTVGGGKNNVNNGWGSVIAGGDLNSIEELGGASFIGGGTENVINTENGVIVGGKRNYINSNGSFIGGGSENVINTTFGLNIIGGGQGNQITGDSGNSNINGGTQNSISNSRWSTIIGGMHNQIQGGLINGGTQNSISEAIILGGRNNYISGEGSVILGGRGNRAIGTRSIAAGTYAGAQHPGSFVRSDGLGNEPDPICTGPVCSVNWFNTTNSNQFLIKASNGVGINTNTPTEALTVSGAIITNDTYKAPSGDAGITQTINLQDSMGACTLTVEAGIITNTTCNN